MACKSSQVVSFANSYFTLADGLAAGFEDYLADNVILVWFDRTVKGKRNVNRFMKYHKINSRHVFNNIVPSNTIDYNKKRKSYRNPNHSVESNETKSSNSSSENIDNSMQSSDEGSILKEEGTSYELSYGDLNELFKLEITPTVASEIEQNIEKIKQLKVDETLDTIQESKPNLRFEKAIQVEGVQFLKADGELHMWKKRRGKDVYQSVPKSTNVWRRPCDLQIAYSLIKSEAKDFNKSMDIKAETSAFKFQESGLLSFEEISELSNHLVPNVNNFGGYLNPANFSEDRDNFLKSFGEEIAKTDSGKHQYIPEYVGNKLIFRKKDCQESKDFVCNYQIHMIIYKGDRIKKKNLPQKFIQTE